MSEEIEKQFDVVKLYLSRPALDRLIGNDTVLEVKLREQVVEEFAKKRLKQLVKEPMISEIMDRHAKALKAELKETIGELVYSYQTGKYVGNVRNEVQKIIDATVDLCVSNAVKTAGNKMCDDLCKQAEDRVNRYEIKLMSQVNTKVNDLLGMLEVMVQARIDVKFEERVQAEAQRRLKAAAELSDG